MKTIIGVALADGWLRAVGVRGGTVAWAAELESGECTQEELESAFRDLRTHIPGRSRRRPVVTVAVGPARAQTRLVAGLPPLKDPVAIARIVQESASTFFLRDGAPLVTTGVRFAGETSAWAGAFARPLVDDLTAACRAAGVRLRAIVPAVVSSGGAFEAGRFVLTDGPVHADVVVEAGRLTGVRRFTNGTGPLPDVHARTTDALAGLGSDARRYAVAFGAAVMRTDEPVVLRPAKTPGAPRTAPRWRAAVAVAGAVLASVGACMAPGITATRAADSASARISALAEERRASIIAERDVRRFSSVLTRVAEFAARRPGTTALLADLARVLPDSVAITDLRLDSAGVRVTLVGTAVDGVAAALDATPGFAGVRLLGPITAESLDSRELQQVTIQFHVVAVALEGDGEMGP